MGYTPPKLNYQTTMHVLPPSGNTNLCLFYGFTLYKGSQNCKILLIWHTEASFLVLIFSAANRLYREYGRDMVQVS